MPSAISGSLGVVAYLVFFAGIGIVFVFVNLLIGRFVRARNPHPEKLEVYECGEPAIGSSFVQFDLRFYVVALIFLIFDVEVAFLFPWATVFGKANHLMQEGVAAVAPVQPGATTLAEPPAAGILRELGVADAHISDPEAVQTGARQLLKLSVVEVLVFFVILLIGFAYVWRLGALDWVRALSEEVRARAGPPQSVSTSAQAESILSV
jgi:NADH-quinone oxidoreductase subunit A